MFASNELLAQHCLEIVAYYALDQNKYKALTFENLAHLAEEYPEEIRSGTQLMSIRGFGPASRTVVDEFLTTGTSKRLEELAAKHLQSKVALDLFRQVHGIGSVTAARFYLAGYRTLDDLQNSGELTKAQALGVQWFDDLHLRISRHEIEQFRQWIENAWADLPLTWQIAGSYRRGEATSGDIDVIVAAPDEVDMPQLIDRLQSILLGNLALGPSKYMGIARLPTTSMARRLDIRRVKKEAYPFALLYFTGSARFNVLMRQQAIDFNLRLNEYEIVHVSDHLGVRELDLDPPIQTEEDIFDLLAVPYLPPSERTNDLLVLPFLP